MNMMTEQRKREILISDAKYISKRTRVLVALFPKSKKAIVQHDLSIAGMLGIEQKHLMYSTFNTRAEYRKLWKSKS